MSANATTAAAGSNASRWPKLTNTLLVAGIGVAVATVTVKLLPQSESASLVEAVTPVDNVTRQAPPGPAELATAIASLHLFGDASRKPVKPAVQKVEEPIRETNLNLQLAGVFAYEPAENAIAIISAGSAEQNAFGIGDKISGETSLEAVYPDHVVLKNRGKLEKLMLPDNVQPIASRPVERASSNSSASSTNADQSIQLPSNPRELRDTLARNPSILGRVVAAEPYQENGKLLGYRITPKQNPEILEAQGIVAGDVITSVNNIQLNSQKQGIRALRNAVKAETLDVTVLRDGIEVPISISLAQ